jgi:hypothetical protein
MKIRIGIRREKAWFPNIGVFVITCPSFIDEEDVLQVQGMLKPLQRLLPKGVTLILEVR